MKIESNPINKAPSNVRLLPKRWDEEILFCDADEYFEDLLQGIQKAQFLIEFEVYIFEDGVIGDRVAKAMAEAARRGVRVRLLLDGLGSSLLSESITEMWNRAGVEYRFFSSPPWPLGRFDWNELLGAFTFRQRALIQRINRRNHRKVCVIDEAEAWVGSINVSDKHLKEVYGDRAMHDLAVRVRGKGVAWLSLAIEVAWIPRRHLKRRAQMLKNFRKPRPTDLLRHNYSRKLRRLFNRELVFRMKHAKERIWVITPYFVPSISHLRVFREAAKRGVDVRIILPRVSDVPIVQWLSYEFYDILLKGGVKIFEYKPRTLHAKAVLIDQWAVVGSCNFSYRSFIHNLEAEVVLSHPENVERVAAVLKADMQESFRVPLTNWDTRDWWKRLLARMVYLIKSWF